MPAKSNFSFEGLLSAALSRFHRHSQEGFGPAHVYYINLDQRCDRRTLMENQLQALAIPFSRWPGTWLASLDVLMDPPFLRGRGIEEYVLSGPNVLGTVGCYLSHLSLLEHIAESGSPQALVFEDDILIGEGFLEVASLLVQETPPWDIILFDCYGSRHAADQVSDFIYLPTRSYPEYHGAHAYLVGGGKTRRLLSALKRRKLMDIDGLFLTMQDLRCYVAYTGKLSDAHLGSDRYL